MCNLYTFKSRPMFYIVCMKILITGANGFLGQHLCRSLKNSHDIIATGKGERRIPFNDVAYEECDLTSGEAVQKMLNEIAPEAIVHTAAMSKPDECEKMQKECIDLNVNATSTLLEAVKAVNPGAHFIYVSSD